MAIGAFACSADDCNLVIFRHGYTFKKESSGGNKANASYSDRSGTAKKFQTIPGYLVSFSRKMKNVRAIAVSSVTILV
jgi:hypothetical protein